MIRFARACSLGGLTLAVAVLSGCPQPSTSSTNKTVQLDSAGDPDALAEAFVRSGGKDRDLLLTAQDPVLSAGSKTVAVSFNPALVDTVTPGRLMWRGPGMATELEPYLFTFEGNLKGFDSSGTSLYLDIPLTVKFKDGSEVKLTVSLRPDEEGEWKVAPPPPLTLPPVAAPAPSSSTATVPSPTPTPPK